jgi:hypothetical protein
VLQRKHVCPVAINSLHPITASTSGFVVFSPNSGHPDAKLGGKGGFYPQFLVIGRYFWRVPVAVEPKPAGWLPGVPRISALGGHSSTTSARQINTAATAPPNTRNVATQAAISAAGRFFLVAAAAAKRSIAVTAGSGACSVAAGCGMGEAS